MLSPKVIMYVVLAIVAFLLIKNFAKAKEEQKDNSGGGGGGGFAPAFQTPVFVQPTVMGGPGQNITRYQQQQRRGPVARPNVAR